MYSRKKKVLKNTTSSLVFEVTTIICGFVLPKMILKSFGSEINGLVTSITQFLGVISFLELGVGSVIQSALYKPLAEKNENEISKIVVSGQKFFSKLAKLLVIYVIILILVYPFIANQDFGFLYTGTMIIVLSISSFAQYYFGITNLLLLSADQKGYISYNIQTLTLILNTVACFVLIQIGASIHIVKLITSLIYGIRPLALSLYVKKHYNINWHIQYEEEPIKQKWNGVAQHISAVVLNGTDNIVLTVFSDLKDVSIYSVYNLVTSGVRTLLLSLTKGLQALIGELWAKQETEKLQKVFGTMEWILHTVTVWVFGITLSLIIPFIEVYTHGIADVNYVRPLFAILIVVANAGYCLRLPYSIMILAAGHYKQTQNNYICATVINIVISILTVKIWGLVGVAIGTLLAMFYQTVWMAAYSSKHLLKRSYDIFIKQLIVDVVTIVLVKIVTENKMFKLTNFTYTSWILLAIKTTLVGGAVVIFANLVFYRQYIYQIINKMKVLKRKC